MRSPLSCLFAVLLGLAATVASAQFSQYTKTGSFERSPVSTKFEIDAAVADAKWDWGRVRASPWFAVRELTFDDNVGDRSQNEESDITATVGAGFRAYLPFGSDMVLATHVLPEYVWWKELSNRRRVNGRAGVGIFGSVGRTTLEASVSRVDEARFFSREFEDQVNTQDELAFLSLVVDLEAGFSLFGSGRLRRLEFRDEDDDLDAVKTLDREEEILRAGIRYSFERGLSLGVGVEETDVQFEAVNSVRSNTGSSPFVQVEYVNPDFFFVIEAVDRQLDFNFAPELLDYSEITGDARIEWDSFERVGVQAWGRRDLVYSFTDRWGYFQETATGLGLKASLASWLGVRVFGETGTADFRPLEATVPLREEDFDGFGIEFQFEIRRATLHLEFSKTDYTSSLPEFDRDVTVIRTGFVFGSRTVSPWS